MANYTLELHRIPKDQVFDFQYELYNNDLKPYFEEYFYNYFYFNEIGFETIGRFKKALQNKLNVIAYKYKEYYKTVVEVETRDFMQTKEIIEEFTREINGENLTSNEMTSSNNNENISRLSTTPKQGVDDIDRYMTQAQKDNSQGNGTSEGLTTSETTQKETTRFESKGNLGVSSDGYLIDKWREIIVDINEKICNDELRELFMLIY